MKLSPIRRRVWLSGLLCGFALMNVALFLHPMSPEDFLQLAFSDPVLSVFDAQGAGVAVFFWGSAALTFAGLIGLLASSHLLNRLLPGSKAVAPALAH